MAHAEKCPICNGSGKVYPRTPTSTGGITIPDSDPCHGCNGKGWVEVGDTIPVFPSPNPYPAPMPYLPSYPGCPRTVYYGWRITP